MSRQEGKSRSPVLVLCLMAALALSACRSFSPAWKGALAKPVPADSPAGAWTGTWQSGRSGFGGRLRCVVAEMAPGDAGAKTEVPFLYHATWHGTLAGTFRTTQPVETVRPGARWRTSGAWKLPRWAGGTYRYDLVITPTSFAGSYEGGGDRGAIKMERPR